MQHYSTGDASCQRRHSIFSAALDDDRLGQGAKRGRGGCRAQFLLGERFSGAFSSRVVLRAFCARLSLVRVDSNVSLDMDNPCFLVVEIKLYVYSLSWIMLFEN